MILIADSGSTKTTWSLTDEFKEILRFETEGFNPYFVTSKYIIDSLERSLYTSINKSQIDAVYFYGAGCVSDRTEIVAHALKLSFNQALVYVEHDLLAAARALLGTEPGFAAILGTGTNTCLYNGVNISLNIDSLGFILGDEGSGAFLGKQILHDYLRDNMPAEVKQRFNLRYNNITQDEIIYNIYSMPMANKYCASFSKFLSADCLYSKAVIKEAFIKFFKNLVCKYPDYDKYNFNCVGSVGYTFRSILEDVSHDFGVKVSKIIKSPMDDLIRYHLEKATP